MRKFTVAVRISGWYMASFNTKNVRVFNFNDIGLEMF
jgi:hypothetical protein